MSEESYEDIRDLLASTEPEELHQGLERVRREISRLGSPTGALERCSEARPLFEMVSAIFYIDPLDHPELVPILDEAVSLVVGFGEWVIPVLVESLGGAGDLKAQMAIGHALGRIGADAIGPLMAEYQASADPERRAFLLYAMGKIESPQVAQAIPLALQAAQSQDRELRDTATRAIGKFVESVPAVNLSQELRATVVAQLRRNHADASPGIRAKAVRSLGKLAQNGHLDAAEREKLKVLCELILGIDENFEWDRAYIVRKEAKEALKYASAPFGSKTQLRTAPRRPRDETR